MPSIVLHGHSIHYETRRSARRRRFALEASGDGSLIAHVPESATDAEVAAFVRAHAPALIGGPAASRAEVSLHTVEDIRGEIRFRLSRRPRRRRMTIMVLPGGEVEVRAPVSVAVAEVTAFVLHHADWVRRHMGRLRDAGAGERQWVTGEPLLVEGREVRLLVEPCLLGDDGLTLRRGVLRVQVVAPGSGEALAGRVRGLVLDWLAERTRVAAEARLPGWAQRLGVGYGQVRVRDMRSRWGSCSPRGDLSLNLRLAMVPPEVLDYVLAHELAHRREPNHSDRFWQVVRSVLPRYKLQRDWLKRHERALRL